MIIGPNDHLEHSALIAQLKQQALTSDFESLLQIMINEKIICTVSPYENLFMLVGSTPF
jgi:hypothetical protein